MFDIGFLEICLIGVVALLVVGPERLPRVARSAGMWIGRARRFMTDVKSDIKAEMEEQDLQELRSIKNDLTEARGELEKASTSMNETLSDDAIAEGINRPASSSRKGGKGSGKKGAPAKKAKKVSKKSAAKKTTAKKTTTAARPTAEKKTGKKKKARKTARP